MTWKSDGPSPSVWFTAALCGITVMVNIVTYAMGLIPNPSMILGFFCFLPMAFYLADGSRRQNLDRIKALEARIEQLELTGQGG